MPSSLPIAFEAARAASVLAFLGYGVACLFSRHMDAEFKRYGLARFRRLVGALECLGALGLLAGQFSHPVLVMAAAGLALLMILAVFTRVRVGDPLVQVLPAIALLCLNAFVLGVALTRS
ncbi:MAG: hypothetical protein FJ260_05705 [Planctomycetes bacterium]|nr:hypothetical protein [Planctomycetota bacterium]